MRAAVSLSWQIFSRKVGNNLITINKEASMQLQYAYVLQQLLLLIKLSSQEEYEVELETGVSVQGSTREVDLLFTGESHGQQNRIAIEMKCYRTYASSGGLRGAHDIFMKDVYFDLYLLEQYIQASHCDRAIALVMCDLERFVNPKRKTGKCWKYDTSHLTNISPQRFDTDVGGAKIDFTLNKHYRLEWEKRGDFWFLENEGKPQPP